MEATKAFYLNKAQSLKEKVKERIARSEKEKAELQEEKLSLQNKLEEVSSELNNLKNLLGNSHQAPSATGISIVAQSLANVVGKYSTTEKIY